MVERVVAAGAEKAAAEKEAAVVARAAGKVEKRVCANFIQLEVVAQVRCVDFSMRKVMAWVEIVGPNLSLLPRGPPSL